VGAYYRPPSDNGDSLKELNSSLLRVCNKSNANTWLAGDFNLGHINWERSSVIPGNQDPILHQELIDILNDQNLTQVVNKNTRDNKTLDLLCVNNTSLVNS
jgi:hypothetical protein